MSDPVITTEFLRWSIPPDTKRWFVERRQAPDVWETLFWKVEEANARRKFFDLRELTIETIAARWGAGVFRINWCGKRDRLKWPGAAFTVRGTDAKPAKPNGKTTGGAPPPAAGNGASSSPSPPTQAQLLGPTAQHSPPLLATEATAWLNAQALNPLALLQAIREMDRHDSDIRMAREDRRSTEHRDAMAQRSQEHQSLMALQTAQIKANADVRIAEAQSSAVRESDAAERIRAELATVREALADAQNSDEVSPAVKLLLDELTDQLDVITAAGEEEGEEPAGLGQQATAMILNALLPELKSFIATKIQGMGAMVSNAPETSGANTAVIDEAVSGGAES